MTVDDVLPAIGNSDHSTVSVCVTYSSFLTPVDPFHRTVFQFGKADWDGFCSFLADVPWTSAFSPGPDVAAEEISQWIRTGMGIYIPSRIHQVKVHSYPDSLRLVHQQLLIATTISSSTMCKGLYSPNVFSTKQVTSVKKKKSY